MRCLIYREHSFYYNFILISLTVLIVGFSFYVIFKNPRSTNAEPSGTPITTCAELQDIDNDLTAEYYLANDIDCSVTSSWNGGLGFDPIGTYIADGDPGNIPFTGTLDGDGHIVSDLYINRPGVNILATFELNQGNIKNIGLEDISITSNAGYPNGRTGGLVAVNYYDGLITNSYVNGSVTGIGFVGGFVSYNGYGGTIRDCYSKGTVTGLPARTSNFAGGFVAVNFAGNGTTLIENCYSTANVNGRNVTGGFVGNNLGSSGTYAQINNCFASGDVSGVSLVGAFIGQQTIAGSSMTNDYYYSHAGAPAICGSGATCTGLTNLTDLYTITNPPMTIWDYELDWCDAYNGTNYSPLRWEAPCDVEYSLTYTPGANGSVNGDTSQTVGEGEDGTEVIAVPDSGYIFVNWSDGVTSASRTDTNVMADINVTANFTSYKLKNMIGVTNVDGIEELIDIQDGGINIQIPTNTNIQYGSNCSSQDYQILVQAFPIENLALLSGNMSKFFSSAIQIGSMECSITLDRAVRIEFDNLANKKIGYSLSGSNLLDIDDLCSADNQSVGDALSSGASCKINQVEDLVVWTKHFTVFGVYDSGFTLPVTGE